jgi:FtsH-binding integral membrane protein
MLTSFQTKTLFHLLFQLSITGVTASAIKPEADSFGLSSAIGLFIALVGLVFGLEYTKIPLSMRFLMFCVFSVVNGILLAILMQDATTEDIRSALLYTIGIFVAMMTVGYLLVASRVNVQPLLFFTMVYSFAMIIAILYTLLFQVDRTTRQYKRLAMVALLSLYIVIQTYFNLNNVHNKDLIQSTLAYYTDILGIFQNSLQYLDD